MTLGALIPTGGGDTIQLNREKLLVGRRSQCDISLRFKSVSSHHCEMEFKEGHWHIRDLGSANGTKVNGIRVDTKCLLPGDEIMFAKVAFNIDYTVDEGIGEAEDENPFAMSLMKKAGLEVSRDFRERRAANKATARSGLRNSPRDAFLMEWLPEDD